MYGEGCVSFFSLIFSFGWVGVLGRGRRGGRVGLCREDWEFEWQRKGKRGKSLAHIYLQRHERTRFAKCYNRMGIREMERRKREKEKESRIHDGRSSAASLGAWGLAPMKRCGGYGKSR